MKKGNLKKLVQDHLEDKSLSDGQLDALLNLQNNAVKTEKPREPQTRWIAVAAVFFIALISNVLYFSLSPELSLDQRIGSEVAKNHINLKPLEIETSSFDAVAAFLTKLDFRPVESVLLKGGVKKLIGGRYCSIQGITAAQLRLKDSETGQVQSLYQTIYDEKVFSGLPLLKENEKPVTVYSKGLAVDIWVEKGILFALTHDSK
ncbi:MAG: hypothetical protein QM484_13815 [Woeseiaceae bacterium]